MDDPAGGENAFYFGRGFVCGVDDFEVAIAPGDLVGGAKHEHAIGAVEVFGEGPGGVDAVEVGIEADELGGGEVRP